MEVAGVGLLRASWHFPEHPLVRIVLGDQTVAEADYLEGSASAHWFVRWHDHPVVTDTPPEIALANLAAQVPEDVDADERLRVLVLESALRAAVTHVQGS